MQESLFANSGQIGQFACAAVSAICAVLTFVRSIPRKYRGVLGTAAIVGIVCLRWIFSARLVQPWTDCALIIAATSLAYFIGRSTPDEGARSTALRPPTSSPELDSPAPVEILQVKLHVSKDERVTFKKKLVITLRNIGEHDLILGPKAHWVPGAISVHRLAQLPWELEPEQGWDSDGWKWQEAEHSELYVARGLAFRTWVALNENATEAEVERLRGRLGTLRIPLRVKIGNFQIAF